MLINAGCGTHYAEGWINCDVWEDDLTRPDVLVEPGKPYPFDDHSAEAIFMGHVLEHIPWKGTFDFMKDMLRIAKPGAPILIVGPDSYRVIQCWSRGSQPWHMVQSVLEHMDENYQPGRETQHWEGAAHHWNCHEARVAKILDHFGLRWDSYSNRIPFAPSAKSWFDPEHNITWPIVGYHEWQFAIMAYASSPTKTIVERPHDGLGMGYMD